MHQQQGALPGSSPQRPLRTLLKALQAAGIGVAATFAGTAGAVGLQGDNWSVDVGGIVNAYYTATSCSGDAVGGPQALLGERYRQVSETMQLWKQAIDLPILDVSYEALVQDPEPLIRRIVGFAGLDWNDACLSPALASRSIATSNQFQVRQPINTASVGRWRHYEEWLQPLIKSLGGMKWIESEQRELAAFAA